MTVTVGGDFFQSFFYYKSYGIVIKLTLTTNHVIGDDSSPIIKSSQYQTVQGISLILNLQGKQLQMEFSLLIKSKMSRTFNVFHP